MSQQLDSTHTRFAFKLRKCGNKIYASNLRVFASQILEFARFWKL